MALFENQVRGSWQIVPRELDSLMQDKRGGRLPTVTQALHKNEKNRYPEAEGREGSLTL